MPAAEQPFSDDELQHLFEPCQDERHLALAVSGGSDSLALMLLAARWAGRSKTSLTVLTVDHGLRPEAAREALLVTEWAKARGLPHVTFEWQGEKPKTGVQAAARQARYRLMGEWCKSNGIKLLATGHTLDDQAETVIMRLARGTGIEGLAGMRRVQAIDHVRLVRPLLSVARDRLKSFLRSEGQPWIDDPSNDNSAFERVRIRQAWPAGLSAEALAETARRALRAHQALARAAYAFLEEHHQEYPEGYGVLEALPFQTAAEEIRIRVLDTLVMHYGAGDRAELQAIERLAARLAGEMFLGATLGGCKIVLDRGKLVIGREPGRIDPTPLPLVRGVSVLWDDRFEITATEQGLEAVPGGGTSGREGVPSFVREALPAIRRRGQPLEADLPPIAAWRFLRSLKPPA